MSDLAAEPILIVRLRLTPLTVKDADEMAALLDDERLYAFIGPKPASRQALRRRYERLAGGSDDPNRAWLNWVVRTTSGNAAIGTVQATVTTDAAPAADVAWIIAVASQGNGFATEAASALIAWLVGRGIEHVTACIHPEHRASAAVAAHVGLRRTDERRDGETVWRLPDRNSPGAFSRNGGHN